MHVLGKVFLGLAIVGAISSIFLTTMLLDVRGHWMDEISKREAQFAEQEEQLAQLRVQVKEAENAVNRTMNDWGASWTAINSQPLDAGQGTIQLGVGAAAGLGRREQPPAKPLSVHVFNQNADGTSQYLGDFSVGQLEANLAAAKLNRAPYTDLNEATNWPQGTYRVRESVPSAWVATFGQLQAQQAIALQDRKELTARLAIQNEHLAASEELRNQRLTELEGDAAAPETAPADVRDGLVVALRKAEDARDTQSALVDQLRRELSDKSQTLDTQLAANRASVDVLNQKTVGASPATASAAVREQSAAAGNAKRAR